MQSVKWTCDVVHDLLAMGEEKLKAQVKPKGKWCPPPIGRLKINVDAAYSDELRQGGTGVGLRDQLTMKESFCEHKRYGTILLLVRL